jgi:hypothetical protein
MPQTGFSVMQCHIRGQGNSQAQWHDNVDIHSYYWEITVQYKNTHTHTHNIWRFPLLFSKFWHRVVWYVGTDVTKKHSNSCSGYNEARRPASDVSLNNPRYERAHVYTEQCKSCGLSCPPLACSSGKINSRWDQCGAMAGWYRQVGSKALGKKAFSVCLHVTNIIWNCPVSNPSPRDETDWRQAAWAISRPCKRYVLWIMTYKNSFPASQ